MPPRRRKNNAKEKEEQEKLLKEKQLEEEQRQNAKNFAPEELIEFDLLRSAMNSNLKKYSMCHYSTINGFDRPNVENSVLKSLKFRIMEDRKAKTESFFTNEKESERKAREVRERKKQYEADRQSSEKILAEVRKLEKDKQLKSQQKKILFAQLREMLKTDPKSGPAAHGAELTTGQGTLRGNSILGQNGFPGSSSILSSIHGPNDHPGFLLSDQPSNSSRMFSPNNRFEDTSNFHSTQSNYPNNQLNVNRLQINESNDRDRDRDMTYQGHNHLPGANSIGRSPAAGAGVPQGDASSIMTSPRLSHQQISHKNSSNSLKREHSSNPMDSNYRKILNQGASFFD